MTPSSDFAERNVVSASCCWRGASSELSNSSVMPRTPFIGVRISWLMVARNSLLALLAASALWASSKASFVFLCKSTVR